MRGALLVAIAALLLVPGVPTAATWPPEAGPRAVSAASARRPAVGVGEQSRALFKDKRWKALHARDVRLVVAWDVLIDPRERAEVGAYLKAAKQAKARVLVCFAHSRVEGHEDDIPSPARWRKLFRQFRKRWPQVRDFQAWNEANHGTQPVSRAPRKAARLFDVMVSSCPRCRISAPAVLDMPNMVSWVERFKAAVRHRPRIWSLHNYLDANRGRSSGTRKLLRHTTGQVWFTETGGIANRWTSAGKVRRYTVRHAAVATRAVFRLARLSPRVKRVYFYNWFAPPGKRPRWDSGLISPTGKTRPAYQVIRRALRHRR